MIYDQPIIRELELLMDFCNRFKKVYIYGCDERPTLIAKYLINCDIKIEGYIISNRSHWEVENGGLPIFTLDEIENVNKEETGIILALHSLYYNDVLCCLQDRGLKNVFYVSEYNKRTISYKMKQRSKEQFWLEVNVADHCNLDCQMCDHFSPIASEVFLDIDTFRKDMKRLAELTNGHIGIMKLQGGEPLLNVNINEFIKITRELFPRTRIFLFTNGVFLLNAEKTLKGNLWRTCSENNVEIQLTQYPINLNFDEIEEKAKEYDVKLTMFINAADRYSREVVKTSVKHPFDLSGNQEKFQFIGCYQFNESITIRNGKIYTCPMIPYIDHFNKFFNQNLVVTEDDYIDIYKANSYEEIAEFVSKRSSFCRYCDVRHRVGDIKWKRSEKKIDEWT